MTGYGYEMCLKAYERCPQGCCNVTKLDAFHCGGILLHGDAGKAGGLGGRQFRISMIL